MLNRPPMCQPSSWQTCFNATTSRPQIRGKPPSQGRPIRLLKLICGPWIFNDFDLLTSIQLPPFVHIISPEESLFGGDDVITITKGMIRPTDCGNQKEMTSSQSQRG
jgi:hypothetical protein